MAVVNGYATLAELKTYIGLSGSGQDTNLENAINGAINSNKTWVKKYKTFPDLSFNFNKISFPAW